MIEAGKSYIQKNPLFGRKVIRFERIRESVWDWSLCDATIVTIDKEPGIVQVKGVASSRFDHQGLIEIPNKVFGKILSLTKLFDATLPLSDAQGQVALRQETGKIIMILTENDIIDENTYDDAHLKLYAEEYDRYSMQQMMQVTDVIDVHK